MQYTNNRRFRVLPFLAIAVLAARTNAAIIINFEEVGGNVVATTTGSLVVPNTFVGQVFSFGSQGAADDQLFRVSGNFRYYNGGTNPGFTLNASGLSSTGSNFGISGGDIYIDATPSGDVYAPNTTWTWLSKDLNAIGQGALTSTPMTVYTASNGETVSFALVPEPSSAMLFGCGLMLLAHRKRK